MIKAVKSEMKKWHRNTSPATEGVKLLSREVVREVLC